MNPAFSILIDGRMLNASGIGTYLTALLPLLRSYFPGSAAVLCPSLSTSTIESWGYIPIPWDSSYYSPSAALTARLQLPSCDTYWSPHFNLPILPPHHSRLVVTIHDLFHRDQDFRLSYAQRLYSRILLANAINRSDQIIAVSHFTASRINHYYPSCQQKVSVIHNGLSHRVDVPKVHRAQLVTPNKFILMVGNIKPHKNIALAIAAFTQFHTIHPDYDLVVVGSKSGMINSAQLPPLSTELSTHIYFTGFVDDSLLQAYYRNCAFFLFPSLYEGFGLPILEAAKQGAKICCSNIPAITEIANPYCHFFDPHSLSSVLNAMEDTLHSTDMPALELQKWLSHFSWQKAAQLHAQVFFEGSQT